MCYAGRNDNAMRPSQNNPTHACEGGSMHHTLQVLKERLLKQSLHSRCDVRDTGESKRRICSILPLPQRPISNGLSIGGTTYPWPKRNSLAFRHSWLPKFANDIRKVAKSQHRVARAPHEPQLAIKVYNGRA